MCFEMELLIIAVTFCLSVWYSLCFLLRGVRNIINGFRYNNGMYVLKGGISVIIIPFICIGITFGGFLFIELFYICN